MHQPKKSTRGAVQSRTNEERNKTLGATLHTNNTRSKMRGAVQSLARLSMCVLGVFAGLGAGSCGSSPARPPRWTALRPESGPLLEQVEREARAALRAGYVPIVELSARWCWPCEELRRESSSPPLAQALDSVALLSLDIDLWGASLAEAGFSDARIPAMYRLDAKGHPQGPPLLGDWKNPNEAARVLRAWLDSPFSPE
jgi:hypothetical protein